MSFRKEQLRAIKRPIRAFLRAHYTDERLVWLLEHARSGKLTFSSCCCLIGIPTADHALTSGAKGFGPHYRAAKELAGAVTAEWAFMLLGRPGETADAERRRLIVPMAKAELRRRERRQGERPRAIQDEVTLGCTV